FKKCVGEMATNPTARHEWQRLLPDDELAQQLEEWSQTETEYPRDNTFSELFQQQVEQTPDAVAVHSDEGSLTYAELNRHANVLAHVLIASGVGPESIVA